MEIKEFQIPVPWGHVAVKAWGNENDTPILTIHGLADNASSFDRLMPFLPTSFYYICIDLPSHGKSSPYPPYVFISALDNIYTYKIVMDYLNRKRYILMGHSWGAQNAIVFTQLYPQYVLKLILLDAVYPFPVEVNHFKDTLTMRVRDLIRINDNIVKKETPLYTYEEAVEKLLTSRMFGELTRNSAEALLKRSLIPEENGKFRFSMDPRLKAFMNPIFNVRYGANLLKKYPVKCPILIVIASESDMQLTIFKQHMKELEKSSKKCIIKKVMGNHDVHNNQPEIVGPIVSKFLTYSKSKL